MLQITNLNDLFVANYKLKRPVCYLKNFNNLNDLSIANVKLIGPVDAFCLRTN
jgi:hypothetical protein